MLDENELSHGSPVELAQLVLEDDGEDVPIAVFGNVLDFKPLVEWLSAI
jgi:hypothetical protein